MSFRETFKKTHSVEDLRSVFKEDDARNKYVDDRFWKPTVDPKTGQGGALIRFLPSQHNKKPFVRVYEHSFQGPTGMWYIEKSLTTLGLPDPVSEYNTEEWMTGDEDKKNEVRKRKRKVSYIANILVVKDPSNPENDGKVFLFKFGKKIFDKVNKMLNPPEDGIEETSSIDPFDMFDGCNFVLRIKKGEGGFPNYDDSKFESKTGPVAKTDEAVETIYKKTYNLEEFIEPSSFKSYEELKNKFNLVMGFSRNVQRKAASTIKKEVAEDRDVDEDEDEDVNEILSKIDKLRVTVEEDDSVPF